MGNRIHVAKKWEVQWSVFGGFNWKDEKFKRLLDALGVYYTGETWNEYFEVKREDWEEGIQTLKNYDNLEPEVKEDIDEHLSDLEYSLEEVIYEMEILLQEADSRDEWMHFTTM